MARVLKRALRPGEYVDHENNVKTDNRRSNLRVVTTQQNNWNKSKAPSAKWKYIGINFDSRLKTRPWRAYIRVNSIGYYIGTFTSAEEAAWMHDQWALVLHGEFAQLNFEYEKVATR
ncbi:HNH endonuclease [Cryobacterium sp. TMT2-15-1]|uniref:HNH endonuclease n=1 Tax=Cryobacterium sp. TMT2-15-1 TaxID=1259246 RepID=UPI00141B1418|nr:HNH endonuclease [Cryobacterium sp. TMT2-15-1]